MTKLLEQFIQYAKEEFGYTVTCEKSTTPDTFETFFGNPLSENDTTVYVQSYENTNLNCEICEHSFNVDFKSQTELFYAA